MQALALLTGQGQTVARSSGLEKVSRFPIGPHNSRFRHSQQGASCWIHVCMLPITAERPEAVGGGRQFIYPSTSRPAQGLVRAGEKMTVESRKRAYGQHGVQIPASVLMAV